MVDRVVGDWSGLVFGTGRKQAWARGCRGTYRLAGFDPCVKGRIFVSLEALPGADSGEGHTKLNMHLSTRFIYMHGNDATTPYTQQLDKEQEMNGQRPKPVHSSPVYGIPDVVSVRHCRVSSQGLISRVFQPYRQVVPALHPARHVAGTASRAHQSIKNVVAFHNKFPVQIIHSFSFDV